MALSAISEVGSSHPEGGGIVVVSGYAGTGKTTLLRTLAETDEITVLAPTGKAALRASEVAPSVHSSTIHRWLYEPSEDPNTGKLLHKIRSAVEIPENRTIFIDEASMVTFALFRDLWRVAKMYNLNLVFMGDGFQLPPVEPERRYQDFSLLASDFPSHYRVEMTEVVRQALDNPIIRASMELRDPRSDLKTLSSLPVIPISQLHEEGAVTFNAGGATICHKNSTRHELNNRIRERLGITFETVQKGEPLMILANNYTLDIYNGEIVEVLSEPTLLGDKPVAVRDRFANESLNFWFYQTTIKTNLGVHPVVFGDREVFGSSGKIGMKFIARAGQDLSRSLVLNDLRAEGPLSYEDLRSVRGSECLNANLGYALTAHKAQGSEFPAVNVCVEGSVRMHERDGRRWLYTAVTRAKNNVRVCWMP